jgi:hypothetical protein
MTGPAGERCAYCYYCADPGAANEYVGICRRFPAPTTKSDGDDKKVWVGLLSWCGEFKLHPRMSRHLWTHLPHDLVHDDEPQKAELPP